MQAEQTPARASAESSERYECPGCGRAPVLANPTRGGDPVTFWCGPLRGGCALAVHLIARGASPEAAGAQWDRDALDLADYLADADTGVHDLPQPAPVQLPTTPRARHAFEALRRLCPATDAAEVASLVAHLDVADCPGVRRLLAFSLPAGDVHDWAFVAQGLGYSDFTTRTHCWACTRAIGDSEPRVPGRTGGPSGRLHWLCSDHAHTSTALPLPSEAARA